MSKRDKFEHLLVAPGKKIHLDHIDPASRKSIPSRDSADESARQAVLRLGELQDALYAEGTQALLVVLQGMDASGKDGTVRKVFDAVNPAGVQVISFKQPSSEDLHHDFLWRIHQKTPPLGYIGVFNRSHYEDVLVVRVHADRLLSPHLRDVKNLWEKRYDAINSFEENLVKSNTRVVKFFLHISKDEQRDRFLSRQQDPKKHWKLAAGDFAEREFWNDYQHAYEKMLPATSTNDAPWYIIPADHNWIRNYCVAHILVATLEDMNPKIPKLADKSLITKKFK